MNIDNDYRIRNAIDEIANTYGDVVSVEKKRKSLLKFGKNADVDTGTLETVWERGGYETYPTTNAIDSFSSSDDGDTQEIVVEGHTIDGSGNLTFTIQTVTLDGQTETSLTTPLARANRVYNNSSTNFAGTVYIYEDDTVTNGVPQTAANIHLQSDGTNNQSLKCATSISSADYWIITSLFGGVRRNSGNPNADFELQIREVSTSSKVFRTRLTWTAQSSGKLINLDPCLIVPKNHDFRVIAGVGSNNTQVIAWANGFLAKIT